VCATPPQGAVPSGTLVSKQLRGSTTDEGLQLQAPLAILLSPALGT